MNKKVSIKDVARAAGVHHSSVSLALRGNPRIPEPTRQRILRVVTELGYKPDRVSMALTLRRKHLSGRRVAPRIAYITNSANAEEFESYEYNRLMFDGACVRAEQLGYQCVLVLVPDPEQAGQRLMQRFVSEGVEGIILGALDPHAWALPRIDWGQFAIAKIDMRDLEVGSCCVCNDQLQATRLAYSSLRKLGYRRIGLAVGRHDEDRLDNRYSAAFYLEQARVPASDRVPPLYFEYNTTAPDVVPTVREWILRNQVEAVLSNWYYIHKIVQNAGFSMPGQVACAGLNVQLSDDHMAGVIQDHRLVGVESVNTVVASLKAGVLGISDLPTTTFVSGTWRDGPSAPLVLR